MSTSQEEENLQGREFNIIWFDELDREPKKWYEIMARSVGTKKYRKIIVSATRKRIKWFDDVVLGNDALDKHVIYGKTDDNVYLDPTTVEEFKSSLTETQLKMRFYGHVGSDEGLVYNTYSPEVHNITQAEFNAILAERGQALEFYKSIDLGFSPQTPTACGWYCVDHDIPAVYRYREYYQAGAKQAIHIENIRKMSGKETYTGTFMDPNNESIMELYVDGFPNEAIAGWPKSKILDGIGLVQSALQFTDTRKPVFHVVKGASPHFEQEIDMYEWNEAGDKPKPKQADHALDECKGFFCGMPSLVHDLVPVEPEVKRSFWEPEPYSQSIQNVDESMGGMF